MEKDFEDIANHGRFTLTPLPDFTPLQGGVPTLHKGSVIGTMGVSGAKSAQQNKEVAKAGVAASGDRAVARYEQSQPLVSPFGNPCFVSGSLGKWVLSSNGENLGTIREPEHPHNMAWGDSDHRSLYLAAQTGIYRVHLNHPGSQALSRD